MFLFDIYIYIYMCNHLLLTSYNYDENYLLNGSPEELQACLRAWRQRQGRATSDRQGREQRQRRQGHLRAPFVDDISPASPNVYYTYAVLYYTILSYTILYYAILYYTILYYTILYYTILYYTILYYTILYNPILY